MNAIGAVGVPKALLEAEDHAMRLAAVQMSRIARGLPAESKVRRQMMQKLDGGVCLRCTRRPPASSGASFRCRRGPWRDGRGLGWAVSAMCRQGRLIWPPSCGHRRRCLRGSGRG
jgi:hypothetical protein